jgi:hypothetical protein
LQKAVRLINQEREKAEAPAKSFPVRIVFWEDLSHDLAEPGNADLLRKHYGEWLRLLVQSLERGDFDHYPIIRAPLRQVFDPLLENRMALFGGREAALAGIADFVRQPKGAGWYRRFRPAAKGGLSGDQRSGGLWQDGTDGQTGQRCAGSLCLPLFHASVRR